MKPEKVLSFLVHPSKADPDEQEPVTGAAIRRAGRLFEMLSTVFANSDRECAVPIRFVKADDGSQQNDVREEIRAFIATPGLPSGRVLARRLGRVTTGKSGLGLLFLMLGGVGAKKKLVISRFPADQGILAEEKRTTLQIEYIERIFMKSAKAYKAALYEGKPTRTAFWTGMAVDKQINLAQDHLANYWIKGFLQSDFLTTSLAGSKRFAVSLREASKTSDSGAVRQEIMSAVVLAAGFDGQAVSMVSVMDQLGLSDETKEEVLEQVRNPAAADESFRLDLAESRKHAAYRSVELDHGGLMMAPSDRFDDCFSREKDKRIDGAYEFKTRGRIVNEKLRART